MFRTIEHKFSTFEHKFNCSEHNFSLGIKTITYSEFEISF